MVLVCWAGLSRGIPGQQDKAWALLCFVGGSGVTEGEAELWLKGKIQRFSSRGKGKVCGISSCALLSYLLASHKLCFCDWLLLTMIIGEPSPQSYSWIFQKTKPSAAPYVWANVSKYWICTRMSNPIICRLYSQWTCFTFLYLHNSTIQKTQRDWNFWMASGLGDFRLKTPWNKYLEVKM